MTKSRQPRHWKYLLSVSLSLCITLCPFLHTTSPLFHLTLLHFLSNTVTYLKYWVPNHALLCPMSSSSLLVSPACCSKCARMCYIYPLFRYFSPLKLALCLGVHENSVSIPSHNPDSASLQPLGEPLYVGGQKYAALSFWLGYILMLLKYKTTTLQTGMAER